MTRAEFQQASLKPRLCEVCSVSLLRVGTHDNLARYLNHRFCSTKCAGRFKADLYKKDPVFRAQLTAAAKAGGAVSHDPSLKRKAVKLTAEERHLRVSIGMKKRFEDPAERAKTGAASHQAWEEAKQDPQRYAARIAALQEAHTPERDAKVAQKLKDHFADPVWYGNWLSALQEAFSKRGKINRPYTDAQRTAQAAYWASVPQEVRDAIGRKSAEILTGRPNPKTGESVRQRYASDPALRASQSARSLQFWANLRKDPVKLAKHIAKLQAGAHVTPNRLEKAMASWLRSRSIIFQEQVPLRGRFYDFFLPAFSVLIETDGNFWHRSQKAKTNDKLKNKIAASAGYKLARIPDSWFGKGYKNPKHRYIERALLRAGVQFTQKATI